MTSIAKNKTYWTVFGITVAGLAAFILYLALRPYSHKPEANIENANTTTPDNMQTPNPAYNTKVRGYRNNNPLNIRISGNNWKGEIKPSGDKSFCQFETMAYGFRAAMCCIRTYIRKYGCNTIEKIINRWAPWSDGNNPVRYASRVCNRWPEDFTKDTIIDYTNRDQMSKLVYAMAIVENGSEPVMEDCLKAFSLM